MVEFKSDSVAAAAAAVVVVFVVGHEPSTAAAAGEPCACCAWNHFVAKSKKQRSDQLHDVMKRTKRSTEQ
jgi:hypothetical protein